MEMKAKAKLNNLRQSPRKVRLVADLIRGKKTEKALTELNFLAKKASLPFKKLIMSAIASSKGSVANSDDLIIEKVTVDKGPILYRRRFRARGRAMPIRKRTSHITLILAKQEQGDAKSETLNSKQPQVTDEKNKKDKVV